VLRQAWNTVLIVFAWSCVAAAQEPPLTPGLDLLGRVKSHMREELSHLPNYTCLETVVRFHRAPLFGGTR